MRTIKKTVLMLTLAVLTINICFLNKVNASSCTASIVSTEAIQGKYFTVSIKLQGDISIYALDGTINYDKNMLTLVGKPTATNGGTVTYNANTNKFLIDRGSALPNGATILSFTFIANRTGNATISLANLRVANMQDLVYLNNTSKTISIKAIMPTVAPTPTSTATPTPTPTNKPTPTPMPTNRPSPTPTKTPVPTQTPTNRPTPTSSPTPTSNPSNNPNSGNTNSSGGNVVSQTPTPRPVGTVLVPSVQNTEVEESTETIEETPTPTPEIIVAGIKPKTTNIPEENEYTAIKSDIKLSKAPDTAQRQTAIYILSAIAFLLIIIILISYVKIKINTVKKLTAGRTDIPA